MVSTSVAASNKSMCSRPVLSSQRRPGGRCDSLEASAWSWIRMVMCPSNRLAAHMPHHPVPGAPQTTLPLRFPTCFNWNQNTPEAKAGIVYDLLFLIHTHAYTKTFDKIFKTQKTKKKKNNPQNLFGYSVDHIKGHGQGPFSPNPQMQLLHLSQKYHVGHPAEVHLTRLAARLQYCSYSKPLRTPASTPSPLQQDNKCVFWTA